MCEYSILNRTFLLKKYVFQELDFILIWKANKMLFILNMYICVLLNTYYFIYVFVFMLFCFWFLAAPVVVLTVVRVGSLSPFFFGSVTFALNQLLIYLKRSIHHSSQKDRESMEHQLYFGNATQAIAYEVSIWQQLN